MLSSRASRRSFLAAAAGLAACGEPSRESSEADPGPAAAPMRLSLSVRVAESFSDKRNTTMTIDELIALATGTGYEALCMRASQVGTHTPAEKIAEVREKIDAAGLKVSMVTGDFAVPSNNEEGPMLLRNITPYLDPRRHAWLQADSRLHEKGRGHPVRAEVGRRGRRTRDPAGPPVALRQPVRDGGGFVAGAARDRPPQLRHHLRTGQLVHCRRGLRNCVDPQDAALPVQLLHSEPQAHPGRRDARAHLEEGGLCLWITSESGNPAA